MKMLILGGTEFLGRHIAEQALARGFEITLFNRGKTNPNFLENVKGVKHIKGDRGTDDVNLLSANWDVVIDTSGREPSHVQRSTDQLVDKCTKYVFVSSISAYKDLSKGPVVETNELHEYGKGDYASNKAECESFVTKRFNNNLIIRPGLIVGPHDPTDRFTYWPWRMHQGGDIVVPNVTKDTCVQFIDVRDLVEWMLNSVEQDLSGVYNAAGPTQPIGFREFLTLCQENHSPTNTRLHWINESLLLELKVEPWIELPFWLPNHLNLAGMMDASSDLAIASGLKFRSREETIKDTLDWCLINHNGNWSAGLDIQKEKMIIHSS